MSYFKYPKTFHLPWSEGVNADDKVISSINNFKEKEIVVTEKLDGENTSMYSDHIHARSINSRTHSSRSTVKALHGKIKHKIPANWRVCGENLYACHSIYYENLESFFYIFAVYNEENTCLSWNEIVDFSKTLELPVVPVLYQGKWNEKAVKQCWSGTSTASPNNEQEGYVVRLKDKFVYETHIDNVAKYVRRNHVQTDQHWMHKEVKPNKLR